MDIDEEGKEITRDEDGESALEAEGKKDDGLEDRLCSLSRQGQANQPQKPRKRKVSFPEDECLVTKSVDPVDPWANASNASSSDVVKAYMNSCARLRIKPIDKVVKQLREHTIFHSRVDILDLKGLKLDVKSCEALEEVFKRVQVYTLDIENTNLEDEGAIALVEMIEFYQSATHISIGYNPRIKTRGWQMFSQMVRKAPFVEFIDMRHCCFNDPCIALLARSLKLNSTLRILHLEGDNLSGKLLIILCTGLKMNHTLAELFLGDNFLIPSDAGTLSAMLKSNCTLQLLDIRNNMLQDQGLMHLCDGLHQQNMGGIKTLVLWNNQISRSGMVPLSNLMAVTKNIQTLNIGHNRLGNDGIHTLQIGLLKNRSLLRLGLLNTKITAEGAVALAEYIADTRTLLRLDLRENDLFVGGLMALTLAVKINETVVRIDLDKDLKKEQGMEGTQTSLLVDIYQYLERNKKLGIKREEVRKKEKQLEQQKLAELEKEKEREKGKENQAKTEKDSAEAVEVSEMTDGNRDTLQGPNDNPQNQGLENSVAEDSGGDEGNSRFTVSLVNDLEHENTKNSLNEPFVDIRTFEKGLVFEEVKDEANATESKSLERINNHRMPESSKLAEQSTSEEDACSPEEFDEELDQLLANVSGVQIDYTDLPSPHDEDFWNKDMQEMLKSSAN